VEIYDDHVRILEVSTRLTRAAGYRTFVAHVDGLLIDSGFARGRRILFDQLRGLPVDTVVNTHSHEDHSGNNHELATTFGATVVVPEIMADDLLHPARGCRLPYQRVLFGVPTPVATVPMGDVVKTSRFTLQAIRTSGHSLDHTVYHEAEHGWLFGGDLFLAPVVKLGRPFENGSDLIESIRRVLDLQPRRFFCYHRGPLKSPNALLRRKLRFLESLQDRARALHADGAPIAEIAARLLGREPWAHAVVTWGDLSKRNLVRSVLKRPGEGYEPSRSPVGLLGFAPPSG